MYALMARTWLLKDVLQVLKKVIPPRNMHQYVIKIIFLSKNPRDTIEVKLEEIDSPWTPVITCDIVLDK